jgi:two-component system, sensor histidine kinase RegB
LIPDLATGNKAHPTPESPPLNVPSAAFSLASRPGTSTWVRLRTLLYLRWLAVVGQATALAVADRYLGLLLPLGLCFLVIGVSVIANLVSTFVFPENKRLSEREAVLMLLFDLAQLVLLLALTGGLDNPFALLIVAPVTISATALNMRSTLVLGTLAVVLVTLLAFFHLPLRAADGTELSVPALFGVGFWLAIVIGVVFLALYSHRVANEIRSMSEALLATQMALAREQKLTDLGGVVAAAAHELGTPLATIKLVSAELLSDLEGKAGLEDVVEDVALIRDQTDRCRDILRSMGRAGKDDLHLRQAPLETVLREAAEPHSARGKNLHFDLRPGPGGSVRQPAILRAPEVIHGLRNLIQNAVDFAHENVWIEAQWTDRTVSVRIVDDGPGYPAQVLGRIGDPFVRSRPEERRAGGRPEYEGMGLGLFIAKTLLERSGAELSFANGADPFLKENERPQRSGAIVELVWPASRIIADPGPVGSSNVPMS